MLTKEGNWFKAQLDQINDFSLQFGLDEKQTSEFRLFVLCVAKDQFRAGNRSGASWALNEARRKIAKGETL